ncbi:MAG: SUMF1/EgtB/PvdO family nonheme iron enzyme [Saprospiraceae bacterium]|nr:SUMF1/EgtB/PvdO family nonheme iron enzyme [Saprospiraceae bacterium]
MRIRFLFLIVLFPLIIGSSSAPSWLHSREGQDHALFFANTNYQNNPDFGDLKNPIKDAETIAKELREMYGFSTEVYKDLDQATIFRILEQWHQRRFGPQDQLFIFFSGHGTFRELTKKGYFVPKSRSNDFGSYIELTDLGNIITQIPCRHILLAVDACYSGTIDQEIAFKGNFQRPGESKSTERDKLIYRQLRNQSRLLITSGGKQRTPDGKQHSPFADAIIKKLRATYTYGDGLCTFQDLLSQLERVSPTPHQGELPAHEQGGFVFAAEGVDPPPIKPDLNHMVFVQGGTFQMGSKKGGDNETPHSVNLSDYYIARHEVTFEEYDRFCQATGKEKPNDHGWGRGKRPAIYVSWYDAIEYCNWRSSQDGLTPVYSINKRTQDPNNKNRYDDLKWKVTINWQANGYRLPTEAEWEYAARSRGKDQKWAGTSSESQLVSFANGKGDMDGYEYTSPVGTFKANDLGLFDMSGNVWEWCWDWYDGDYYAKSPNSIPKGPNTGSYRVLRGGSWNLGPAFLRCADRFSYTPDGRNYDIGFRLSRAAR